MIIISNPINFADVLREFDRGDPADYDFDTDDFTKDANWNTLDLSPIVPVGAVSVEMFMALNCSSAANVGVLFRKGGNSNGIAVSGGSTNVTNNTTYHDVRAFLDENRHLEYNAAAQTFVTLNLSVTSWKIPA